MNKIDRPTCAHKHPSPSRKTKKKSPEKPLKSDLLYRKKVIKRTWIEVSIDKREILSWAQNQCEKLLVGEWGRFSRLQVWQNRSLQLTSFSPTGTEYASELGQSTYYVFYCSLSLLLAWYEHKDVDLDLLQLPCVNVRSHNEIRQGGNT